MSKLSVNNTRAICLFAFLFMQVRTELDRSLHDMTVLFAMQTVAKNSELRVFIICVLESVINISSN